MDNYTNHSGGCPGSDISWERKGKPYGVHSIAYSYRGHNQEGEFPYIMSTNELLEGWKHVQIASKSLHRPLGAIEYNPYVRNLLCRNWFQVKHSDAVFAIGKFNGKLHTRVDGGTGWAVQMAIDNNKTIYFFNQPTKEWYIYFPLQKKFINFYDIPTLTEDFAGIGTRELNLSGMNAIDEVYQHTFKTIK